MEKFKKRAVFEHLEEMLEFVRSYLIKKEADKSIIPDIILSVEELLVNVISYAFPEKDNGDVEIKCSFKNGSVILTFIDGGIEFDVTAAANPDTTQPMHERKIGGMGIYLVRNVVDEMIYERRAGKNILTIKKKIK